MYTVERLDCDLEGFDGYRVTKQPVGHEVEATYDVLIDTQGIKHSCECQGFLRHGRCKHLAMVKEYREGKA